MTKIPCLCSTSEYCKGMTFETLKTQVENEILQAYIIAEKYFGPRFELPTINYDLRGTKAGTANYVTNTINLNKKILLDNPKEFIQRTPGHEAAHLITRKMFGRFVASHGKEWKRVMGILGLPAVRCHNYVVKTDHEYSCKCEDKTHYLSTIRHNRIQKRQQFWYCKHCGEQLAWKKLCCQERTLIPV